MPWQDSDKRRQSLFDLRDVFREKGYVKTAEKIAKLSGLLDLPQIPGDFEEQWRSIILQFEKEFAQGIHADFRKVCLQQVAEIVLTAIQKIGKDFPTKLLEIYYLFQNMRVGKTTAGNIGSLIRNLKDSKSHEERFYLLCFAYLIMIEGIFDDCVRILYFLWKNSKGIATRFLDVKEMKIRDIKERFEQDKFPLIFLEKSEEKNHLRNSIGHARFSFDPSKGLMHFLDINPFNGQLTYDRHLDFNQFAEISLQIEDAVEAFLFFFLMIKTRDFILSPTPYK